MLRVLLGGEHLSYVRDLVLEVAGVIAGDHEHLDAKRCQLLFRLFDGAVVGKDHHLRVQFDDLLVVELPLTLPDHAVRVVVLPVFPVLNGVEIRPDHVIDRAGRPDQLAVVPVGGNGSAHGVGKLDAASDVVGQDDRLRLG